MATTADPVPSARLQAWLVAVATGALLLPVYVRLSGGTGDVRGENDFVGYLVELERFELWPFTPTAPHFLLPALARLAGLGADRAGLVLVVTVAAAATFGGIARLWPEPAGLAHRPGIAAGTVVAGLLLAFETPSILFGATHVADVHHWASGTDMLFLALFVPVTGIVVAVANGTAEPGGRLLATLGLLAAASTLAKPSLALAALVAVPVFLLRRRGGDAAVRAAAAYAIPTSAVLAWQGWFLLTGRSPFDSESSVRLSPFWVFGQPGMDSPLLYLVLSLPLLALAVRGRAITRDPWVGLAAWLWLAAAVPTLLLEEAGPQRDHANFTVGSRLAFFLVMAATFRNLWAGRSDIVEMRGRPWPEAAARVALCVLLVSGWVAGVVSYVRAVAG